MAKTTDIQTAKTIIVEAAARSGLLREVAEALWFANKHGSHGSWERAAQRELVDQLAGAFDDHSSLPAICADNVFGEGLCTWPGPDEVHEVDAFIGNV
jgi:hypothetical protein